MRAIAIANHKGIVGKSTTAINLDDALIRQGKKALISDMILSMGAIYEIDGKRGRLVSLDKRWLRLLEENGSCETLHYISIENLLKFSISSGSPRRLNTFSECLDSLSATPGP